MHEDTPSRIRSGLQRPLTALAVYAAAAVAATWPIARHLTTRLAGDGADAHLFLWNHWWFRTALHNGENPYVTDVIYWPTGTSLVLHTLSPLNALAATLLEPMLGLVGAYNALLLASFALAAWAAHLLARHLTGSDAAAYVAGLGFGFTSYHYAHALGHLNLASYHWLAFFALFWHQHLRAPTRRTLAASALTLVAAGLTDLSLLLTCGLLAAFLALATHGWRAWRRWLTPTATAGALAALPLSPLLVAILVAYWRSPQLSGFGDEAPRYSVDFLAYAVPTPLSTLYGRMGAVLTPGGTTTEATVFLGFGLLALAAVGLRKGGVAVRPWVWVGAAFFALSLGPTLHVAGFNTHVPMPYALLRELPVLSTIRTPARFALGVALAAAVLAAYGVRHLLPHLGRFRPTMRPAALALVGVVLVAEAAVLPFPTTEVEVPATYRDLPEDAGALVPLPLHQPGYEGYLQNLHYLTWQTEHGHPVVTGYTSRETVRDQQFMTGELVLAGFDRLERGGLPPDHPDIFPTQNHTALAGHLLEARGLTTLLLHRSDPATDTELALEAWLDALPGVRREWTRENITLYRAQPTGEAPPVLLDLERGWHGLELWNGTPFRWTFDDPTLLLEAREETTVNLSLEALPFLYFPLSERQVDVILNGEHVGTWTLPPGWSNLTLEVPLEEGPNRLELRCREPAMSPQRLGLDPDPRPLGLAVRNVTADPVS